MSSENRCPDCGNNETRYVEDQGEIVCTICGLVIEDTEIEKKPYINDNRKSQATQPYLSEAGGQHQSGKIVKSIWLLSTREKNYEQAKKQLEIIGSKLKLSQSVITEANIIYKRATELGLNIGRNNLSILYGGVYAACIIFGVPKTPLEITMHGEISKKKLMKAYRLLKKNLELRTKTINPSDLVPRFGSRLGLKHETISKALEILSTIKDNPLFVGKNPQTITASALYIAAKQTGDDRTQRDVANATGIIEVTIRKRSKEIANSISS